MISIHNLSKFYGPFRALDRISFEVGKGEILGLLGPNGAGKSTTMRILTCYLPPTSGTVRIGGHDILENPLEVKKLIGYLPEFAPLYADMLVYDYLSYVASIRELSAARKERKIAELVDLCGLDEVMHRPFRELSRGYKQRVGLAHALLSDPEILVLDEPTSGLDPNQIVEIRAIIKEIGREKTIIFSTHILSEAEATCDRIIIIDRGRIVADGAVEDIKSSDHIQFRLSLVGAGYPDVRTNLTAVPGVEDIKRLSDDGAEELRIKLTCSRDNRTEISRVAKARDWILIEFTKEKGSLETIFRELTRSDQNNKAGKKPRRKRR
ncbi:MAG TPA: ATP-binding cassette domain-containing protein [bacterium]|nr:ATP-binding cassette domain-containing protein [bacterium]